MDKKQFISHKIQLIKELLKDGKYDQVISEFNELVDNHYLTLKQTNELKQIELIAKNEIKNKLHDIFIKNLNRKQFFDYVFNGNKLNLEVLNSFFDKFDHNLSIEEIALINSWLLNRLISDYDRFNLLAFLKETNYKDKNITVYHKASDHEFTFFLSKFSFTYNESKYYSQVAKLIEEHYFKEPSIMNSLLDILNEVFITNLSIPLDIKPIEVFHQLVNIFNNSQNKNN